MSNLNISDGSMGDAIESLGIEHFTVWSGDTYTANCRHTATKELVVCPKTGANCRVSDGVEIKAIARSIELACEYLKYTPSETDPMVSMQARLDSLEKANADLLKSVQQLTGAGSPPVTEENTEAVPDGMDERAPGDEEQPHEADDAELTPEDEEILALQDKAVTGSASTVATDLLDENNSEEDLYKDAPAPPEPEGINEPELLTRAKKLRASNLND